MKKEDAKYKYPHLKMIFGLNDNNLEWRDIKKIYSTNKKTSFNKKIYSDKKKVLPKKGKVPKS